MSSNVSDDAYQQLLNEFERTGFLDKGLLVLILRNGLIPEMNDINRQKFYDLIADAVEDKLLLLPHHNEIGLRDELLKRLYVAFSVSRLLEEKKTYRDFAIKRIADAGNWSVRTIREKVKKLEAEGWKSELEVEALFNIEKLKHTQKGGKG